MMLRNPFRDHKTFFYALLLLATIWTLKGFGLLSAARERLIPTEPPRTAAPKENHRPVDRETRSIFMKTAAYTDINGAFDDKALQAIRAVCDAQKSWHRDIVFISQDNQGGIGNVRESILACVRYAIDAGAGFILPRINRRADDLTDLNSGDNFDMEYMFDRATFVERLALACPQMPLYESVAELEKVGKVKKITVAPRDEPQEHGTVMSIMPAIEKQRAPAGEITLVSFLNTLGYYPICADGASFANNFGKLLEFRRDVREFAASILFALSYRFTFDIDPAKGITRKAYLGAHLRSEEVAVKAGFPTYAQQTAHYFSLAKSSSLAVIYMASGDAEDFPRMANDGKQLVPPITVVTKQDLLSAEEMKVLSALRWDQQALVDYIVLQKSSYFGGIAESSFSEMVAMSRRLSSSGGTCSRRGKPEGTDVAYRDELSELSGGWPSDWHTKMWP